MNQSSNYFYLGLLFYISTFGSSLAQSYSVPDHISKVINKKISSASARTSIMEYDTQLILLDNRVKKSQLQKNGIRVRRSLEDHFYIVSFEDSASLQDIDIKSQWVVNDLWKLQTHLLKSFPTKPTTFVISTDVPFRTKNYLSGIKDLSVLEVEGNNLFVHARIEDLVKHVIHKPEVRYIGSEATIPTTEARVIDMNLNPNTINKIHHFLPTLNGEGMTVSIQEFLYDKEDIDLKGRDIPSDLSSNEVDIHSTEMATIVAGAGNSFITGKGVAWGANITSSDFENILPDDDQAYRELNTWVQNHSYGTVPEGFYGIAAEAYDRSANNNPALLHIFSAGNQGLALVPEGVYDQIEGYSNLTGNFKHSKNTIVVGSVDTVNSHLPFSSKGPAYDGRVKPELVAYASVGTSNSAALVSGISVLMQQAYLENNGDIPDAALVKAILINSAKDVGNPQVDFTTGYGNVDGYRSVNNIKSGKHFFGTIAHGEEELFTLNLPSQARNLKITLVWNDPVSLPGSFPALTNDLDMVVSNTSGQNFLPWVLSSEADPTKLSMQATRKEDHLNNIEQVTISNPTEEIYTIHINGFDIPEGPQDFYIAYQWDISNQFEWDYPTGSDNLPFNGESGSYFRWKSSLPNDLAVLEYSLDNGATWDLINDEVDLPQGLLRWEVPQNINSKAIARMRIGEEAFLTDEFTISRPRRIQVGFNCGDSLLLQWDAIEGISEYNLFTYNNTALKNIRVTSDTSVVINSSEIPSNLVTLEPVVDNNLALLRNEIIDYTLQGVGCYVSSFFPEAVNEDGLYLNLQLGTNYLVNEIIFERKENNKFIPIGNLNVSNTDSAGFRFLDSKPNQGLNINRAKVVLNNGAQIVTEESQIYFLTDIPFLVFPNPTSRNKGLNVFTKQFEENTEVLFELFDRTGQQIISRKIISDRENIGLENVKRGLYIYHIIAPNEHVRGRVVVR